MQSSSHGRQEDDSSLELLSELDRITRMIEEDADRYYKTHAPYLRTKKKLPKPDPYIYQSFHPKMGPTVNRLAQEKLDKCLAILESRRRRRTATTNSSRRLLLPGYDDDSPYDLSQLPPAPAPSEEQEEQTASCCRIYDHRDIPGCSETGEEEQLLLPVLFVTTMRRKKKAVAAAAAAAVGRDGVMTDFYLRNSLRYGSQDGAVATTMLIIASNDAYFCRKVEEQPSTSNFVQEPSCLPAEPSTSQDLSPPPCPVAPASAVSTPSKAVFGTRKNGEMTSPPTRKKRKLEEEEEEELLLHLPWRIALPKVAPQAEDYMPPMDIFTGTGQPVPDEVVRYWEGKEQQQTYKKAAAAAATTGKVKSKRGRKKKIVLEVPPAVSEEPPVKAEEAEMVVAESLVKEEEEPEVALLPPEEPELSETAMELQAAVASIIEEQEEGEEEEDQTLFPMDMSTLVDDGRGSSPSLPLADSGPKADELSAQVHSLYSQVPIENLKGFHAELLSRMTSLRDQLVAEEEEEESPKRHSCTREQLREFAEFFPDVRMQGPGEEEEEEGERVEKEGIHSSTTSWYSDCDASTSHTSRDSSLEKTATPPAVSSSPAVVVVDEALYAATVTSYAKTSLAPSPIASQQ